MVGRSEHIIRKATNFISVTSWVVASKSVSILYGVTSLDSIDSPSPSYPHDRFALPDLWVGLAPMVGVMFQNSLPPIKRT